MNIYETRFGATFNGFHSFRDLGFYPLGALELPPPQAKTLYLDLPGADGSLDLTTALTGRTQYADRKAVMKLMTPGAPAERAARVDRLVNLLHGRAVTVIADEAPDVCLIGRAEVEAPRVLPGRTTVTVQGVFLPWRRELTHSAEPWLWDPFSFENGVAREYAGMTVAGRLELTVIGSPMPVCPVFTVGGGALTLLFRGGEIALPVGVSRPEAVTFAEGEHTLVFTGTGTVDVAFYGGRL